MGLERHPLPRTLSLTAIFLAGRAHLATAGYPPLSGPTGEPDGRHGYSRRSSMEHVSVQLEQPDQQLVVPAKDPDIGQRSQNLSPFAGAEKRQDPLLDQPCFVECIIRNISEEGALLSLIVSVPLPREILLWEQGTGKLYECGVKWRKDHMVGVHFVDVRSRLKNPWRAPSISTGAAPEATVRIKSRSSQSASV